VPGLYARYGVRLLKTEGSWARTRCFTGRHRDRHPSASVNLEGGTWRCHTCRQSGGVLDALQLLGVRDRNDARRIAAEYGIELSARSRPSLPGVHRNPVAPPAQEYERIDWAQIRIEPVVVRRREWVYVDKHGTPIGRTVRLDQADGGKRIWAERPHGERWVAGLAGRQLPLYRLPEVRKRARAGKYVLVVEGEKKVDALDRLGSFATTSPGGAGKWRSEHTTALRGARVTVIADCDKPGRLHAIQITQELLAEGLSVQMPLDPNPYHEDGFDIADHLAGVAQALRATTPEISRWRVRWLLRQHLDQLLRTCPPADPDALRERYLRIDTAGRDDIEWLQCERCGKTQPHQIALTTGFAYCPCGGFRRLAYRGRGAPLEQSD
jgi:hypothetical protein